MNAASVSCASKGAVPIGSLLGGAERDVRPRRSNDESEAERRKQALRERSDVEDGFAAIERLQRIQRPIAEAELCVVVVLDHDSAAPLREFQQRGPARRRHDGAERKLMRWRDADDLRLRGQSLDDQAFLVYRNGSDPCARGGERRAQRRIPGFSSATTVRLGTTRMRASRSKAC